MNRKALCSLAGVLLGLSTLALLPGPASADPATASLFAADATPATASASDNDSVEVGVRFTPSVNGTVTALRFYKGEGNTGPHTGTLWADSDHTALGHVSFTEESATGWQTAIFDTPVAVTKGTTYVASYFAPHGHYAFTAHFFDSPLTSGPLTAPDEHNGVFKYSAASTFPTDSFNATNYWVDITFVPEKKPSPSPSPSSPSPTTSAPAATTSTSHAAGGTGGGGALPVTGTNAALVAGSGALLAVVGVVLFVVVRRRRDRVRFVA